MAKTTFDGHIDSDAKDHIQRHGPPGVWTQLRYRTPAVEGLLLRIRQVNGKYVASIWTEPPFWIRWMWHGQSVLGQYDTLEEAKRAANLALFIAESDVGRVCELADIDDARRERREHTNAMGLVHHA
jgi:hypothetical protein